MIELPDEKTPDKDSHLRKNQQILDKEGTRILSKINDKEFVIALAIEGQQFPSVKNSVEIPDVDLFVEVSSDITFVIGGSLGLSTAVKKGLICWWVLENWHFLIS